jgi:hypothetical protein
MQQVQEYDKGAGIGEDEILKRRSTYKESKSSNDSSDKTQRGSKFKLLAMKLSGSVISKQKSDSVISPLKRIAEKSQPDITE